MYPLKQIRLWSRGFKKYRHFTIVVCYKKSRHRGAIIERLGHFNPQQKERQLFLNTPRLAFWLNKGASLHKSVWSLIAHRSKYDQ